MGRVSTGKESYMEFIDNPFELTEVQIASIPEGVVARNRHRRGSITRHRRKHRVRNYLLGNGRSEETGKSYDSAKTSKNPRIERAPSVKYTGLVFLLSGPPTL